LIAEEKYLREVSEDFYCLFGNRETRSLRFNGKFCARDSREKKLIK
jgi:hypothetical protein